MQTTWELRRFAGQLESKEPGDRDAVKVAADALQEAAKLIDDLQSRVTILEHAAGAAPAK